MRNEQGAMGNAALPAPSNGQTVYKYFQKWQCYQMSITLAGRVN